MSVCVCDRCTILSYFVCLYVGSWVFTRLYRYINNINLCVSITVSKSLYYVIVDRWSSSFQEQKLTTFFQFMKLYCLDEKNEFLCTSGNRTLDKRRTTCWRTTTLHCVYSCLRHCRSDHTPAVTTSFRLTPCHAKAYGSWCQNSRRSAWNHKVVLCASTTG